MIGKYSTSGGDQRLNILKITGFNIDLSLYHM